MGNKQIKFRIESDSFGEIEVPADKYWGAQTQRSLLNFKIGNEQFPQSFIRALAIVKRCAAITNMRLDNLDPQVGNTISRISEEIIDGKYNDHFPLIIWQTGSGTQTNMNMNEVIANLANIQLGSTLGSKKPVHPNDHCNKGQSTNDTFPTAMHISVVEQIHSALLPALQHMKTILSKKVEEWNSIIKIGRTHLQDATPIALGQEFSGYHAQIENGMERINDSLKRLYPLVQGGTAVGTGLNAKRRFDQMFVEEVSKFTGLPFIASSNKFEGIASHDALVELSGILNTLVVSLHKIANDIRLLGSGPRAGISELFLPENEPGSSIMPGKVNPTQSEALTMVCTQVMGNHTTITFAGAHGHLELNAYKPVIAFNILQSIQLISDAIISFTDKCIKGIKPNHERISELVQRSLMLVTALSPRLGYENAAKIAKAALENNTTLREEAIKSGQVSGEEFDEIVDPKKMISPQD